MTAHGRPVDGRDAVGVGEQIATIHLIADFAASEKLVRNAAREGLTDFATWDQGPVTPADVLVSELRKSMPDDKAVEAAAQIPAAQSSPARQKIAQAAREALKRL